MNIYKAKDNTLWFDFPNSSEEYPGIVKNPNTCCSLCTLSIKEYHTIDEIKEVIDYIKKDSNSKKFKPDNRDGGEKCLNCVVSPGEDDLRTNLINLNFTKIWTFPRRNGYPIGELELWALNV